MRKLACLLLVAISCNAANAQELSSIVERSAQSSDHINFLHQREWVRLDAKGSIAGKLMVLGETGQTEGRVGAKVLVSRDGKIVRETKTDVGGVFSLDGLKPGTYAIQCRGDYTFAAYALHVLPADATHLTADLEIYASVIPEEVATSLLTSDLVPADLQAGSDVYYRDYQKDPIAAERKFNNSHKVVLRDGTLVGRVSRPGWTFAEQDLSGTVAQIVQSGKVVAKTAVGKDGYYEFKNVQPGVYDLFITGNDGFAVLAFEAIASNEPVASKPGSVRMVSTQVGMASDCLCCEMIQQPEIVCCEPAPMPVIEEVVVNDPCGIPVDSCGCGAPPVCGSGYSGGFSGGYGGGGGGGFGHAGGLLGIAGLAVGIAAIATNNDDNGFNVNLATPFYH